MMPRPGRTCKKDKRGRGRIIATSMEVRLDKWLQVARVFKTRTRATQACTAGRVKVNTQPAKAGRILAEGDRVEIRLGSWTRVLVVRKLHNRTLPKRLVPELFEDLSPPRPVTDPVARLLAQIEARPSGAGRPTKKERRELERFKKK